MSAKLRDKYMPHQLLTYLLYEAPSHIMQTNPNDTFRFFLDIGAAAKDLGQRNYHIRDALSYLERSGILTDLTMNSREAALTVSFPRTLLRNMQ